VFENVVFNACQLFGVVGRKAQICKALGFLGDLEMRNQVLDIKRVQGFWRGFELKQMHQPIEKPAERPTFFSAIVLKLRHI
jgi:hypothetical protein